MVLHFNCLTLPKVMIIPNLAIHLQTADERKVQPILPPPAAVGRLKGSEGSEKAMGLTFARWAQKALSNGVILPFTNGPK